MSSTPEFNQFPRGVIYPLSPNLLGYLAGMAAEQVPMHFDGLDYVAYELSSGIDKTLAERTDFQAGVNEALDFHRKMSYQLPKREFQL